MDGESFFASVVTIAIFAVIFVVLAGGNPDPLINLFPTIVMIGFVIALAIAITNSL